MNELLIIVAPDNPTKEDYESNLIIFGTPEENSAIKKVNPNLWFPYDDIFSNILSNEKIELLPETSQTATFFELKISPSMKKRNDDDHIY